MTALTLQSQMNPVLLPPGIERGLRPASQPRSEKFLASYEYRVLFYDVFWHADGKRVLLVGPPPIDLGSHYRAARYQAVPSGKLLRAKSHHTPITHLYSVKAPSGTTHLDITFAGVTQRVAIAPNHADFFAGERLLFTLSKDNDLNWIADWAQFHVVNQGVTAVMLFDNNSTRYSLADIEATLLAVPGLRRIAVLPVPFTYPMLDDAVPEDIFWAHFLQPAVMVSMFRRYGLQAQGILNCDIDELAVPLTGQTVFDAASRSRSGTVYYRTAWIEPVPEAIQAGGYRHHDFRQMAVDVDYSRGQTQKWALTPHRRWLQRLKVQPHTHVIANRPIATRHKPDNAYIAHFKAISTGWKYERPVLDAAPQQLKPDAPLQRAMARAFADGP